jgi:hypothetical protein
MEIGALFDKKDPTIFKFTNFAPIFKTMLC